MIAENLHALTTGEIPIRPVVIQVSLLKQLLILSTSKRRCYSTVLAIVKGAFLLLLKNIKLYGHRKNFLRLNTKTGRTYLFVTFQQFKKIIISTYVVIGGSIDC